MKSQTHQSFLLKLACITMCLGFFAAPALAAWPEKPVKLVVPYSPGGGADTAARTIAGRLSELLGQPVIIENKPGAGGVIGADTVAKSAPDGYTVLFDASAFVVNPALRKMPFDAVRDFVPISLIVKSPMILVVAPNSPYNSVADLIAAAKKNPKKLSYASSGAATASHLAAELFTEAAKIEALHVPYKGGGPAMTDVMAGSVDFFFSNIGSSMSLATSGKLKVLGLSTKTRLKALPNAPTMIESGIAGFEVFEWNGVFLPKGTPVAVIQRLSKELQAVIADPKVNDRLIQAGVIPVGDTPAEFAKYVEVESKRWQTLVKSRGIGVE